MQTWKYLKSQLDDDRIIKPMKGARKKFNESDEIFSRLYPR